MNEQFNILKGLGIMLVVAGHVFMSGFFHNLIYLFHIPLFYIVSGYFFKDKYLDSVSKFVWRRFVRLYIPYICWGVAFIVFVNAFVALHWVDNPPMTFMEGVKSAVLLSLFKYTPPLLGAIWFLKSLLFSNLFFMFVRKLSVLSSKRHNVGITVVASLALYAIGIGLQRHNIQCPLYKTLNRELCVVLFICIGWLYHKFVECRIKYNISYIIIALIVLLVLAMFFSFEVGEMSFSASMLVVSALIGFYLMLAISHCLTFYKKIGNFICYIGTNTIPILALHFLAFKIVTALVVGVYRLPAGDLASYPVLETDNIFLLCFYVVVGIGLPLLSMYVRKIVLMNFSEKYAERKYEKKSSF